MLHSFAHFSSVVHRKTLSYIHSTFLLKELDYNFKWRNLWAFFSSSRLASNASSNHPSNDHHRITSSNNCLCISFEEERSIQWKILLHSSTRNVDLRCNKNISFLNQRKKKLCIFQMNKIRHTSKFYFSFFCSRMKNYFWIFFSLYLATFAFIKVKCE